MFQLLFNKSMYIYIMIGYCMWAFETPNGDFIISQGTNIRIGLKCINGKFIDISEEIRDLYPNYPNISSGEEIVDLKELEIISKSSNCISPEIKGYHRLASDGLFILDKDLINYHSYGEFIEFKNKRDGVS